MKLMMQLDRDEISRDLPYAIICETRASAKWDTSHRRRLWNEQFTEAERNASIRIFQQAHSMHLVKGVPDSLIMTPETYRLWVKLGAFCANL